MSEKQFKQVISLLKTDEAKEFFNQIKEKYQSSGTLTLEVQLICALMNEVIRLREDIDNAYKHINKTADDYC